MVKYRLTLPDNEVNESVPRERRAGHPVLQTQPRFDAQMNETIDQKSVRAGHRPTLQGVVPLGVTSGPEIAMEIPFEPSANMIDTKSTDGPQDKIARHPLYIAKIRMARLAPDARHPLYIAKVRMARLAP